MTTPARRARPPGVSLSTFLSRAPEVEPPERAALLALAQALLTDVYVHRQQKQARYGIDPVQQLRVLRQRMQQLSTRQFHDELTAIFTALRDRHTGYLAPAPYAGRAAVLPFLVERCHGPGGKQQYVVSKLAKWCRTDPAFRAGVQLSHWNGSPLDRAVQRNAESQRGANDDARTARGLTSLTTRSLGHGMPPDDDWVVVTYRAGGRSHEARFEWRVIDATVPMDAATPEAAQLIAHDPAGQAVQRARQQLYAPGRIAAPWLETSRPPIFSARPLSAKHGYLRIWSFADGDDAGVLDEACRLVSLLPRHGIVIDIRGNPGGNVPTAERLLQIFTAGRISPAGFSLADTDVTLAMSRADPHELGRWTHSLQAAVSTGEPYSQAFPLTSVEAANDLRAERRYPGPAALIVDPLTYSAADIFAAGFQDNDIGPVLGTARTTGAGGANVWTGAQIAERTGDLESWPALPASGAAFTVAVRRATRVGGRAGLPLEDIGVVADEVHAPTQADLTHGNRDLLRAAVRLLVR